MARVATVKDVLYALEHLGARLCMQPATAAGKHASWVLEPGAVKVPPAVADEARAHSGIVGAPSPSGTAVYVWSSAA